MCVGVPKMRNCITVEVTDTKLRKWNAELKLKVLGLGLGLGFWLATAVTTPALATHDYDGLAEYSALTQFSVGNFRTYTLRILGWPHVRVFSNLSSTVDGRYYRRLGTWW